MPLVRCGVTTRDNGNEPPLTPGQVVFIVLAVFFLVGFVIAMFVAYD